VLQSQTRPTEHDREALRVGFAIAAMVDLFIFYVPKHRRDEFRHHAMALSMGILHGTCGEQQKPRS
jgi:hypothetical protein